MRTPILRVWQFGSSCLAELSRGMIQLVLLFCLLASSDLTLVVGQGTETWAPPECLSCGLFDESGAPANAAFPVLLADEWGDAHAFWPAQFHIQTGMIGDTVYYARWDGAKWSAPIDVINMAGDRIVGPKAVATSQGWLHLVWRGQHYVWYSRVLITEAGSAQAWSTPRAISYSPGANAAISAGVDGVVHVVYCTTEEISMLYHSSSTDGNEWSSPVQIESGANLDQARIAIDDRARLHVAFRYGNPASKAVYYTRSDDGGQSWLSPLQVDQVDGRYEEPYSPNAMTIATVGDDQVHLVWLGPPRAHRWHQWSADGGDTWSPAAPISTDLRLSTWPSSVAEDSLGRLHLMSLGRGSVLPFGLYHTYWHDRQWSPLVQVVDWGDQRVELAITQGNMLHAIWDHNIDGRFSIWTSQLKLDAPSVPSHPSPTVPPTAMATSLATITNSTAPATTSTAQQPVPKFTAQGPIAQQSNQAPWFPVLAGALPVMFLIGLVVLRQWWQRR